MGEANREEFIERALVSLDQRGVGLSSVRGLSSKNLTGGIIEIEILRKNTTFLLRRIESWGLRVTTFDAEFDFDGEVQEMCSSPTLSSPMQMIQRESGMLPSAFI